MKSVMFAVLMLFAFDAIAENLVVNDASGNQVTLMSEACTASSWLKDWKLASFLYKGKAYEACWRLQGTTVVILDSGGEVTPLPSGAFRTEVKN